MNHLKQNNYKALVFFSPYDALTKKKKNKLDSAKLLFIKTEEASISKIDLELIGPEF